MCRRVKCKTCGKATWAGCGGHISIVLAGIKEENRCKCSTKQPDSQSLIKHESTNKCVGTRCLPQSRHLTIGKQK